MKKILYAAALAAGCGLSGLADEPATLSKNASPIDTTDGYVGKLGVGVMVGEPTGASLEYWLNDSLALDGAVGWSYSDNADLYVHSDVLWHKFDLIPVSQGRLPVYFGVGVFTKFRDNHQDNEVGVRAPVGLSYMLDNTPTDIFVEIGPAIGLAPGVRGEITGGVGIRYWF